MSSVKDFILDESDDTNMMMTIQSNTLEPITINSSNAKFIIPTEGGGILSRDSYFSFAIKTNKANGFLPIGSGIFSLIRRAELRISGQRICVQDNLSYWKSITKSYDTPSFRNSYDKYLYGINTAVAPCPVGCDTAVTGNVNTGFLTLCGAETNLLNSSQQGVPYELALTTDAETTQEWSVKIGDLFPILDDGGLELPLFLIKGDVEILLTFNKQSVAQDRNSPNGYGSLACFPGTNMAARTANSTAELVLDKCLLYMDNIYYTDSKFFEIEESVNAEKGIRINVY